MRILELCVWILTGLQVAGVITLIAVQSIFGVDLAPSTVSEEEADAIFAMYNPHWQAVAAPNVQGRSIPTFVPGKAVMRVPGATRKAGGRGADGESGAADRGGPGASDPNDPSSPGFTQGNQPIRGGGARWTEDEGTGLPEAPPVYLPQMLVDRYRHAQQARDALMSAESADIPYGGGTAVQLGRMAPDSPLAKYLGLQPGDIVVSVNGYQVSKQNGMDLHARLRDERRFRVEIDRGGARFIAKYEIK